MTTLLAAAAVMATAAPATAGTPAGTACHATGNMDSYRDYYGQAEFFTLQLDATGTCVSAEGRRPVTVSGTGFSPTCSDTARGPRWDGLSFGQTLTTTDPVTGATSSTEQSWISALTSVTEGDSNPLIAFDIGYDTVPQGAATIRSLQAPTFCEGYQSVTLDWVS